jgi:hypothetical protein
MGTEDSGGVREAGALAGAVAGAVAGAAARGYSSNRTVAKSCGRWKFVRPRGAQEM